MQTAEQAVLELRKLPDAPSAIEVVDENLLQFIDQTNPNQLKDILDKPFSKLVVLIEFDSSSDRTQKRMVKKTQKILDKYEVPFRLEREEAAKETLWKIRRSAAAVIAHSEGSMKALPIIEDGIVPVDRFQDYIKSVYEIFNKHNLKIAIWGHAGNANLHMQPFMK